MGGIEMYDSQRNVSRGATLVISLRDDKGLALVPLDVLYVTVSGCEKEPRFYADHVEVGEAIASIYLDIEDEYEAVLNTLTQLPTAAPSRIRNQGGVKQWDSPPSMTLDTASTYMAVFELEKGGEFVVELYTDKAPRVVNNFVFLAREGFYDGVTFHRVLEGFMAQSGDPTGTGTGGPGYRFESEFHPDLRHDSPGIVSMANAGGLATNGSQFFITFREASFLDYLNPDGTAKDCSQRNVSCHSVFGKVISGMDVVNSISLRNPFTATTAGDVIRTIRIMTR